MRHWLIAYDIAEETLRRKVHRELREWRLDGQLSVHECPMTGEQARQLFDQLKGWLDPATDRLMMVALAPGRAVEVRGTASDRLDQPLCHIH
jgi:CRISPR-associated protein Cas2